MTTSAFVRTHVLLRLAILALSALTMLWLLWRFPLETAVAAIALVVALFVVARLAKPSDGEVDPHENGLHTH